MAELDRVLTPDSIVVSDASYSSIWTSNFLLSQKPGMRFLSPRGLAGLGWGLPFALGAKAAAPDATVFCLAGDGGFAHVWSELETSVRLKLPVVITVLNNAILGYQTHAEDMMYGDHSDACDFAAIDHAAIARACGCRGIRITDPAEYASAIKEAMESDVTTLIEVMTDPKAWPPITSFEA